MTTDRFVHEFALAPTPQQARILRVRLDLARQLYNAFLGEASARLTRCKSIEGWKQGMRLFKRAKALRKHGDERGAQALRREAKGLLAAVTHQVLREERTRYAPETLVVRPGRTLAKDNNLKAPAPVIVTRFRQAHFEEHLDFKTCEAMATRAYQAVDQIRFKRPTRRKDGTWKFPRVHFVRYRESRAVDSKSMHFRFGKTLEGIAKANVGPRATLEWNSPLHKLRIPVLFDLSDPKGVEAHAVAQMQDADNICESIRVLARTIRGEERWYCQVTIKGEAHWKAQYVPAHGKTIGIDFGPSQIGIFSEQGGAKLELAAGLRHDYARIRRLQRYLDRSRRATNPDNYNADRTIKRLAGQRLVWHKSQRYLTVKAVLADLWRTYAAHRKNLLGRLANEIMTLGTTLKIEQLNYKAWQKTWGKSIGRGAPGMLVRELRRKAAQVGGALVEFPTRTTKFSQLCHGCGTYTKKPLRQRVHRCECGIGPVDRDVYSAFLAYHYDIASQTLDVGAARVAFAALLCRAVDVEGSD